MGGREPTAELARLFNEIARLEAELKTASLRDPATLAEYARTIRQLRCQCEALMHKRAPNGTA